MTLSAVIAQSLTIDVGRTSIIALSVLVLTGAVRLLWGWLMKSAREDFRDSIGKIVDEKIGSLQSSLVTMSTDLGDLASALREERQERHDLRVLIETSVEDLRTAHGETTRTLEETTRTLEDARKTLDLHGSWIAQIAAGAGIDLQTSGES